MFTNEVYQMTLANDVANRLFDNMSASSLGADKTFLTTLRALLHKRLSTATSLSVQLIPLMEYQITPDLVSESIPANEAFTTYRIYIIYPEDKRHGKQFLDNVLSYIGEGKQYLKGFKIQEDLRVFYVKMFKGLFYSNGHSTLIFLDFLNVRRYHALQMMIPRYLTELFFENPLTESESELLKSLGLNSSEAYEILIEEFAKKLDMRREIIRSRLRGFESAYEREQVQKATHNIEKYQKEYQEILDKLRYTLNIINDQQIILSGLQCQINSKNDEDSELMDYFLCNKQLTLIAVRGTGIEFIAHGYADVFDEEAFDTYVSNHASYLYEDIHRFSKREMESFYKAIFSTGVYKLRLCAAYFVDLRNNITPLRDYYFPPDSNNYLPNPHIQIYGCVGGYEPRFAEYMRHGDYIGAIEQASISARNLNFHDSSVMRTLVKTLLTTKIKCIESKEGELLNPGVAIERLEVSACQSQSE